ncbi:MAG TPA: response regulator transcription factor [Verrucomicrobiae bacterium]|nr:response regulator transcription factor [Verrucomicrobiae bacterium]
MLVPILESDPDYAALATAVLRRQGVADTPVLATLLGLLDLVERSEASLVVADAGLLGGRAGVGRIRQLTSAPLIVLEGTGEPAPALLTAGADHVLAKPFAPGLFRATVEAVLRRLRIERSAAGRVVRVGPLTVEPVARSARIEGRRHFLSPREVDLLEYLALNAGVVVSRRQVIAGAWGDDPEATPQAVTMCVHRLRRKLEADPHRPRLLCTRRGDGYVLVAAASGTAPLARTSA